MNPIKSFFNSLFDEIRDERDIGQKAPPAPIVPAPPEPPLEMSCYIKGVIKSMMETPDKWLHNKQFYSPCFEYNGVSISCRLESKFDNSHSAPRFIYTYVVRIYPYQKLNKLEEDELANAHSFVTEYHSEKHLIAEEEKNAKIIVLFEKLGCPDNTQ